ncbi:putative iq calmodulin-binding domain-containing protein [Erysiphe neolycopersici]|uniref:Putative iq calmodulin-binding domain-containing protein n=1 Tax=Erysiphe neolycopersici TaxID=212602 RepID=A0A420HQQ9_9PEZI|nr:putative iq calmodulin-binding domain-containing protein [Erysiphe neolycopersici]
MTTLLNRSSHNKNGQTISKIDQRHKIIIISDTEDSRKTDKATIIGYKRRRQNVSSTAEVPSISRKRTKLKSEFSNCPQEPSIVKLDSKLKEDVQCSTSPIAINNESDFSNPSKEDTITTTSSITHDDALENINCLHSSSKNSEADHKWKLRSHDSSRFKSELSIYFPEYDVVIGNKPEDDHVLNVDTPIVIFDSAKSSSQHSLTEDNDDYPLIEYPDSLFIQFNDAEKVNFSDLLSPSDENSSRDLLCETYFNSLHKKPYRAEKTIRNTDKERAQHDRIKVTRLLEGLQGQDWFRLLGVHGVPDSKKKEYEAARQYFIRGCELIVAKFQVWRDEEKRQRLERDFTLTVQLKKQQAQNKKEKNVQHKDSHPSALKQNFYESTAKPTVALSKIDKKSRSKVEDIIQPFECNQKLINVSEPYTNEVTLEDMRPIERNEIAWGYPVPEIPEKEFKLPLELRDDRTLRAHAREKRLVERDKKKVEIYRSKTTKT